MKTKYLMKCVVVLMNIEKDMNATKDCNEWKFLNDDGIQNTLCSKNATCLLESL